MTRSESAQHSSLKDIMRRKMVEWFEGIALKEYMTAGHEADVYGVTRNGVVIHIEIVWTPERFNPNHTLLEYVDEAKRKKASSK